MALLIAGVLLWSLAHLAKRLFPGVLATLGAGERPVVAGLLVLSVVLMVAGYRMADTGTPWWAATPMLKGLNNLMVLAGIYLFAAAGTKARVGTRLRHPQLTGFSLWAAAHLLVNGDLPSLVLFGGLLVWALTEIVVINRAAPWAPPAQPVPLRKEWTTAAAALAVFVIVGLIHGRIGPNPFGA